MRVTRSQVDQIKTVLGLDKDLTHSIAIHPQSVHIQMVALVDGHPDVQDGMTLMTSELYEIEEGEHVDS